MRRAARLLLPVGVCVFLTVLLFPIGRDVMHKATHVDHQGEPLEDRDRCSNCGRIAPYLLLGERGRFCEKCVERWPSLIDVSE